MKSRSNSSGAIRAGIIMIIMFGMMLAYSYIRPGKESTENTERIEAEVIGVENEDSVLKRKKKASGKKVKRTVYYCDLEIEYTYNEEVYTKVLKAFESSSSMDVGDTIYVNVDKDNPEKTSYESTSKTNSFALVKIFSIIFLGFGIFVLIFGIKSKIRERKHNE